MPDTDGPPNKWNEKVATGDMSSDDYLNLLNEQAAKGNTSVLCKMCTDGEFTFFGNYNE